LVANIGLISSAHEGRKSKMFPLQNPTPSSVLRLLSSDLRPLFSVSCPLSSAF